MHVGILNVENIREKTINGADCVTRLERYSQEEIHSPYLLNPNFSFVIVKIKKSIFPSIVC